MALASENNLLSLILYGWLLRSIPFAVKDRAAPPLRVRFRMKVCRVFCGKCESLASLSLNQKRCGTREYR